MTELIEDNFKLKFQVCIHIYDKELNNTFFSKNQN